MGNKQTNKKGNATGDNITAIGDATTDGEAAAATKAVLWKCEQVLC